MNILYTKMIEQADPTQVAGLARFFKTGPGQYGEGDKFLGIKVPVTREVVKGCWKQVDWADLEECISSEFHEVRLAALLTLVDIFKHAGKVSLSVTQPQCTQLQGLKLLQDQEQLPGQRQKEIIFPGGTGKTNFLQPSQTPRTQLLRQECIDFYLSHTAYINNWDLVDLSCYPLLGEWLLDKDRKLLYELARNGKTIWEQRIGMVSTMTFIRHGELQDTFAIADILLYHPHDLIHKAVGWLLREAGKRDKNALEEYLRGTVAEPAASENYFSGRYPKSQFPEAIANPTHATASIVNPSHATARYQQMPRTMLRYAIEKFPEEERQQYLAK